MPFRKLIHPFTLTGWGGGVVRYMKSVKNSDQEIILSCSDLRHKATAKKQNKTKQQQKKPPDCFIFLFLFSYIIFLASFKEKTSKLVSPSVFYHPHFPIRIFPSAFCHPHFVICILSSTFCHPHFVIRISYPPSAIRHPPPSIRRHQVYHQAYLPG